MKQSLFNFFFGEGVNEPSPKTTKGLKERGFFKPSLHSNELDSSGLPILINYRLVRSNRKSVGFIVDEHGLTVRAPRWVTREEIEILIHQREEWIREKLSKMADRQHKNVDFVDGAILPYLGESVRIRLDPVAEEVRLVARDLVLNLPDKAQSDDIKESAQKWFKNEAKRILGERLEQMAQRAAVTYSSWRLSSARGRWGCCTSARTIRLNWRLIHLDVDLIDYVIAHELAHLDEMNHGSRFWHRVHTLCPNFESRRRRLKNIHISELPLQ